jgi:heme/copper-type cytochrome/quinol oxidase subunit 3
MHSFKNGDLVLFTGLFAVVCSMAIWWRDVIREATFNGHHTKTVQSGLRQGMILFIVSEIMFFFAFFWAFFPFKFITSYGNWFSLASNKYNAFWPLRSTITKYYDLIIVRGYCYVMSPRISCR